MAEASQASTSDDINIKVKTMQPATYDVKIPVQAPVAELKKRLVDIANVPQDRQRVIYKGRVLENDQLLSSHGVQEGHTLHLVERMLGPPQQAAGQPAEQPGQRHIPVAMGSLELDTDETDVNALMANIFQQLGGHGQMPGIVPGDGGRDAGEDGQHRRAQEAQFIAQQLMDSLGQGGPPAERPPNMLASIQSYLNRTQEFMQNPTVLLPSLPDPPASENELREQRRLMEAVRSILTSSVQSELGSEQQAFLQDQRSWEPPVPSAGSSSRQSTATRSASAQAAAPTDTSAAASAAPSASPNAQAPADATAQDQSLAASIDAGDTADGAGAAALQQPAEQQQQQQQESSNTQSASGARRDAPSSDMARSADGRRHRRSRRPAISPVVTMALGSLLQSTLQGDAYRDPAGVLTNAAQLLLSSHSFDGGNRQQVLDSLRAAGSHLYRLAPLLLELARAFSGAVAAMQGHAGPLALNASSFIRPDGSAPAIGHTPSGAHQQIIGSMTIPLFPGMPMGAVHMGPEGPVPNMAGPTAAPAANGPAGANAPTAGGRGPGSGVPPPGGAGAGQGAGRGQGMGLNQALTHALQAAMVQAGGQAARPGPGAAMTETRQVIQVPGAPPISIRFGARPAPSQRGAEAQQAPADAPVTLQVGSGARVSLSPLIQVVSSMLGSAIHSAVASATPASANPAATNPVAASANASVDAPAAASAAHATAPPGSQAEPPQPGSSTRAPAAASGSSGSPAPASLLAPPVMHQVLRALMHVIGPLISAQAAPPSTSAVAAASAAVAQAGPAAPSQYPLAPAGHPCQIPPAPGNRSSAAAEAASDAGAGGSRPATAQRPLGMSEPLSEMIGAIPADATTPPGDEQADAQAMLSTLMRAGVPLVNPSGPTTAPDQQPGASSVTTTAELGAAQAPTAASLPPESTEAGAGAAGDQSSSKSAEASDAAAGRGGQRPSQRAMGLGSALPPREKGSKKSHPRSSMPNTSPSSPHDAAGCRQAAGRPAPSVPQQDNVKRARHGDNTLDVPPRPVAGTDVEPAVSARAGSDAEEEIPRPVRGSAQAGSAGGLDAMLAQVFGGGGEAAGGSGSGGLNLNSHVQGGGGRSGQSGQGQGTAAGGQGASGLLGALAQSIGPMMQQLMVGDGRSANAQGPVSGAPMRSSTADWRWALSELDGEEQAEWERVIRADLQKQAELAPERYKDHSTAYLAGGPPSTKKSLLPGDASPQAGQEESD